MTTNANSNTNTSGNASSNTNNGNANASGNISSNASVDTRINSGANESLLKFPCDFPLKVMGRAHPEFAPTIVAVIRQFDDGFDEARIEIRSSGSGNYTGLTITVRATSRAHLDDIYRALTGHPMVKVVL